VSLLRKKHVFTDKNAQQLLVKVSNTRVFQAGTATDVFFKNGTMKHKMARLGNLTLPTYR